MNQKCDFSILIQQIVTVTYMFFKDDSDIRRFDDTTKWNANLNIE